ncbi:MAG: ATP-binding cassette domain-containing protein [Microlunatus sp.]
MKTTPYDGTPYIETRDLSLVTREGPVYEDVELAFPRGRLAAIVGRSGSGRSALLLTLAGRMRGWTGWVRVAGYDPTTQTRLLRDRTSLALVDGLVGLEPRLTVAESITERSLIDAVPLAKAGTRFEAACAALEVEFPRTAEVGRLSALDQTRLAVALATMRPAEIVFLDSAHRGLDEEEGNALMSGLEALVAAGTLVVLTALESSKLPPGTSIHRLPRTDQPVAVG